MSVSEGYLRIQLSSVLYLIYALKAFFFKRLDSRNLWVIMIQVSLFSSSFPGAVGCIDTR